jgi:hypothetical protein
MTDKGAVNMEYRCPVCGFTTASDAILARHMASTLTLYEHHLEWIESKGIAIEKYSPVRSLKEQEEFCNDLRELVARACRIRRCLATA